MNRLYCGLVLAVGAAALSACNSNSSGSASANAGPAIFTAFVNSQVGTSPTDATPASTDNFASSTLGLDDTQAFANVQFSGGDAIDSGTYSAAAACTSVGSSKCSPGLH